MNSPTPMLIRAHPSRVVRVLLSARTSMLVAHTRSSAACTRGPEPLVRDAACVHGHEDPGTMGPGVHRAPTRRPRHVFATPAHRCLGGVSGPILAGERAPLLLLLHLSLFLLPVRSVLSSARSNSFNLSSSSARCSCSSYFSYPSPFRVLPTLLVFLLL